MLNKPQKASVLQLTCLKGELETVQRLDSPYG